MTKSSPESEDQLRKTPTLTTKLRRYFCVEYPMRKRTAMETGILRKGSSPTYLKRKKVIKDPTTIRVPWVTFDHIHDAPGQEKPTAMLA